MNPLSPQPWQLGWHAIGAAGDIMQPWPCVIVTSLPCRCDNIAARRHCVILA